MRYRVKIEIDKVNGECHAGHREGDSWTIDSPDTPLAICPVALVAVWQKIYGMLLGADFWWAENSDVALFSCPDLGIVTFKISREPLES